MENKKCNTTKECHLTSIGGQAVMEGVMMRGPKEIATAVRKSDGEIIVDKRPVSSILNKFKFLKLPIIRGVISFFESMIVGVKCLMFSAEQVDLEDGEEQMTKFEKWLDDKLGDKIKDIVIYFAVFVSLIFSIGLFMLLPHGISSFIKWAFKLEAPIVLNLLEGVIRITIFILYIGLVGRMKDIRRVFEYHGAEHKSIACYEHGDELTPENAKKYSRLHPRCGTNFLLVVMFISIISFSVIPWGSNPFLRVLYRLLLLPFVAGISYEIIKIMGRSNNKLVKILTKPGLMLQYLTTREPDEEQLEVAICALKNVMTGNKDDDKW